MQPPRSAEAIATGGTCCPIMYSIALSTTEPARLSSAGGSCPGADAMDVPFLFRSHQDRRWFIGLHRPQPGVKSIAGQQRRVGASFLNRTVVQHDDLIGVDHR